MTVDTPSTDLSQAQRLLEENDPRGAEAVCRRFLIHHPAGTPSLTALLGASLAAQGKFRDALDHLERLSPIEESLTPWELLLSGEGLLMSGRAETALAFLERAVDLLPEAGRAHSRLGIALALRGRLEPARKALENAARLLPKDPASWINLARVTVRLDDPQQALDGLETADALAADALAVDAAAAPPKKTLPIRIEALVKLERLEEARALLPAEAEMFDDPRFLHMAGLIEAGSDRPERAESLLRQAVVLDPGNVVLLESYAHLLIERGLYAEAHNALEEASAREPENAKIRVQWANALLRGNREGAAKREAERVLELAGEEDPASRALALTLLGDLMSRSIQPDKAERYYQEALEIDPCLIPALMGLGHLFLQLGRLDESASSFEKVRETAPIAAFIPLVNLRRFPEDEASLDEIEQTANQPGLNGSLSASLLLATARAWEKREAYGRAFRAAKRANDHIRKRLPYDADQTSRQAERIVAQFNPAFFAGEERGREHGAASRLPIFVVGMPRSGTTLTEQILAAHPRITGAGELGHIQGWSNAIGSILGKPEATFPDFAERLVPAQTARIAQHALHYLKTLAPGAERVVDKQTFNYLYLGLIRLLFPRATVIHCVREPRDVAVSNYMLDFQDKFGMLGFSFDLGDIGRTLVDCRRLMNHWHATFPGWILDVRYEELVEDPEPVVRRMLDHAGMEWDPAVLDFQENERQVRTASSWQVRQPIYTTSRARWRNYAEFLDPLENELKNMPPERGG